MLQEKIDDLEVLLEFSKEGEVTEEEVDARYEETLAIIEDVEFRNAMDQPEDKLSCYLEINAGAGGTESCDWANMLLRL